MSNSNTQPIVCLPVDIGYGYTKTILGFDVNGDPIRFSFPSELGIVLKDSSSPEKGLESDIKIIKVRDQKYAVGPQVKFAGQSGSVLHRDYIESDQYLALLRGAMAYRNAEVIDLMVLGLPHSLFHQRRDQLIALAEGEHEMPGGHRCHVKKAIVVSQPVAAAYNFTSRLLQKYSQDELSKLMILTLEGGWFTFDWTLAEGTKVLEHCSSSHESGSAIILQAMCNKIGELRGRPFSNLRVLEDQIRRDDWKFGGDDLSAHKDEILAQAERITEQGMQAMLSSLRNDKDQAKVVVGTGGSIGYYEKLILKHFKGYSIFISPGEDRQWDVVEGLARGGRYYLSRNQ